MALSSSTGRPARLGALLLTAFVLTALLLAWGRPLQPGPHDPVRWLTPPATPQATAMPQASVSAAGTAAGPAPTLSLQGRLLADSQPQPDGSCHLPLAVAGGSTDLMFRACPHLQEGWRVRVVGRLVRPQPAPHPLLNGPAERLARQGIWSRLHVEELQILQRPATPIADLRRAMAQRLIARCGAQRGGLLAALVLGSAVVPLPLELRNDFRAAGLSHALAASGFHLSVLLGLTQALGRPLGRGVALLLAVLAMALFLLLAGSQPSVVRAVLMAALALVLLQCGQRQGAVPLLLFTSAAMVLLRPDWLADVGFQLSVAATAGLLLTARPLEQALAGLTTAPAWRWLPAALAVPLAASLWTLPLQWLHFGALPLYAVPANLLAAPLLSPLTLGAMGLALAAVAVPPLLPLCAWPVERLADLLILLAHGVAQLPMAQWQTGRLEPWLALLLALGLWPWLQPSRARRWRPLAAGVLVLTVGVHLNQLLADRCWLVHQGQGSGGRDLLLARHQGRLALVSRRADGGSCRLATQFAAALGSPRLDWIVLLDPLPSTDPTCWRQLSDQVSAEADAAGPLALGQQLASPGLAVVALHGDSRALALSLGHQRWLLLPDRQALMSLQPLADLPGSLSAGSAHGGARPGRPVTWPVPGTRGELNLWLGFSPSRREQRLLAVLPSGRRWLSGVGPAAAKGWRSTGASGSLSS